MAWGDVQLDDSRSSRVDVAVHKLLTPNHIAAKVVVIYVAVIIPFVSFALSWENPVNAPSWQTDDFYGKLSFTLTSRFGFVFFPLLIYANACLLLMLLWRSRFGDYFLVRGGVYTGVVLGLHFSFVYTACLTESPTWMHTAATMPFLAGLALCAGAIAMATIVYVIPPLFWWLHRHLGYMGLAAGAVLFVLASAAFNVLVNGDLWRMFAEPLVSAFLISLVCGPYWYLVVFAFASFAIARTYWDRGQIRIWHMFYVFTWLGGYLAAVRISLEMAAVEYAKLPTTPPEDCYIATAAARGHRRVVRSKVVRFPTGELACINDQLRTLKLGEIALKTCSPRLHRKLRRVYDWLGPLLARRLSHPLLADVVYLSLKPCEWAASIGLRIVMTDYKLRRAQVYAPPNSDRRGASRR